MLLVGNIVRWQYSPLGSRRFFHGYPTLWVSFEWMYGFIEKFVLVPLQIARKR
jgi:hypothetical protein